MSKLSSSLKNMFVSLTLIAVFSGGILATVNKLTTEPIALAKTMKLEAAVQKVVPAYDNSPLEEAYVVGLAEGDSLRVYPAKLNGSLVGRAVESNSLRGFSGEIRIIVGFDAEGVLVDYTVLEHAETPGLGSKMEEWFRDADKLSQNILGRSLAGGLLAVRADGGKVDAITAATISSRAFLDAVNRAYRAVAEVADAASGATEHADGGSGATEQTDSVPRVKEEGGEK